MTAFKRTSKGRGEGCSRNQTRLERTWELAPFIWFVSSSKGEALSLSRSRFSIIYRSGENLDWFPCGLRSSSSILWLWRWVLSKPDPDRGRSGGHQSYLHRVFRLKEEGRQWKCQRRNRKSRALKWNSSKIHCSILLHALLPKCREDLRGQIRVGPESHGRGGLSEIIYYRILWIT